MYADGADHGLNKPAARKLGVPEAICDPFLDGLWSILDLIKRTSALQILQFGTWYARF